MVEKKEISLTSTKNRLDKEAAYHVDRFPKSRDFLAYHPS